MILTIFCVTMGLVLSCLLGVLLTVAGIGRVYAHKYHTDLQKAYKTFSDDCEEYLNFTSKNKNSHRTT